MNKYAKIYHKNKLNTFVLVDMDRNSYKSYVESSRYRSYRENSKEPR